MDTFEFTEDDAFKEYLTDIIDQTPPFANLRRNNLISKNSGQYTEFLK